MDVPTISLKIRHFKCFGTSPQGFDTFKPFNVLIGRNNSGKSTLLDIFPYLVANKIEVAPELFHDGQATEFILSGLVTEEVARRVFSETTSGGEIGGNHWQFGSQLVGAKIVWRIGCRKGGFVKIGPSPNGTLPLDRLQKADSWKNRLAASMPNPFQGLEFRRITAERDVTPENDSGGRFEVAGNGRGVTDAIQGYINKAALPSELVESELLERLNVVFQPDAVFTDIVCQQLGNGEWEIYLEENSKGRIPLSQSGSGLKTVIIVLVHIILLPHILGKEINDFIFGFEELENNLHPSLLRRLLNYLFSLSVDDGPMMLLTTHSNVAIDFFSKDENAQILHVTHDGCVATCRTIATYVDNNGILDDLDVRASDILQSNCVIWVEGPSDRIYINRWISMYSGGKLHEGMHYQCVFYGGRLLSHLCAAEPDVVNKEVAILSTNRHVCIVIDSDKRAQQSRLNETKKRVSKEIEAAGGVAWITKGREIENYLSRAAVAAALSKDSVSQIGQYEAFSEYLDSIAPGQGKKFLRQKPIFAERIVPHMDKDTCLSVLDLGNQLQRLCTQIERWNAVQGS